MNKILVLSEGKKTEPKLLEKYLECLKGYRPNFDECNLEIVTYNTNIYVLYNKLKEFSIDGEIYANTMSILKMMNKEHPDEELTKIIENKYPYIYLIFDYELHDKLFKNEEKFIVLRKMQELFNDETENGFLLFNFPMIEAYRHFKSFDTIIEEYKDSIISCEESHHYKNYLSIHGNIYDINKYKLEEFELIVKANMMKINYLITNDYKTPEYNHLMNYILNYKVLDEEIKMSSKNNKIYVICLASLLFLLYYGEKYYNLLLEK